MNKGWEDHHSPPVELLFDICWDIHEYLKANHSNVVVVHCMAGKGRTGSLVCCYLMFSGRFSRSDQAMSYYQKKRGTGVTHPSQIRYVEYFQKILFGFPDVVFWPKIKEIQEIILHRVPQFGGGGCKPCVDIYFVKDRKRIYSDNKKNVRQVEKEPYSFGYEQFGLGIVGDIQFKISHIGMIKNSTIFRFAFNTAMCENNK